MRRPRKPFVTEYKTGNRRSPAGFDAGFDAERPASKAAFDLVERGYERGDEPLDAAMRAADALFSRRAPPEASDESHDRAASEHASVETADDAAGKAGGRILRALDEEPAPVPAAIEGEHVPKRRGRKPGSKNKPKVHPVDLVHAVNGPETIWPMEQVARPKPTVPPVLLANLKAVAGQTSKSHLARRQPGALWKGDRLKRWEGWKRRRLPRVCW